jgi:hypothetical protein
VSFDNAEIDPVKYGVLWERVQQMDKKIDKMEQTGLGANTVDVEPDETFFEGHWLSR